MKFIKLLSIGIVLTGFMSSAFAEDGFERTKNFKDNFRAEQARLWGPDVSEKSKQKIAQEKQKEPKGLSSKSTTKRQ